MSSPPLLKEYTSADQYALLVKDRLREDLEELEYVKQYGSLNYYKLGKVSEGTNQIINIKFHTHSLISQKDYYNIINESGADLANKITGDNYAIMYEALKIKFAPNPGNSKIIDFIIYYMQKYFSGTERRLRSVIVFAPSQGNWPSEIIFELNRDFHEEGEVVLIVNLDMPEQDAD